MSGPIVRATGLTKVFPMRAGPVTAVDGVDLVIEPGESVSIRGPSGCGKSTLLHLVGCVETPTDGTLEINGYDVARFNDGQRSRLRLTEIGFVFQRFFLLPMLSAFENVELPQAEAGIGRAERRARAKELLDYVGLAERASHRPSQLSGGEMQRVAIARALANRPSLLLADEPTGELDDATSGQISSLLEQVHRDGTTVVIVTHDAELAARAGRQLLMRSGRLVEERRGASGDLSRATGDRAPRPGGGTADGRSRATPRQEDRGARHRGGPADPRDAGRS